MNLSQSLEMGLFSIVQEVGYYGNIKNHSMTSLTKSSPSPKTTTIWGTPLSKQSQRAGAGDRQNGL